MVMHVWGWPSKQVKSRAFVLSTWKNFKLWTFLQVFLFAYLHYLFSSFISIHVLLGWTNSSCSFFWCQLICSLVSKKGFIVVLLPFILPSSFTVVLGWCALNHIVCFVFEHWPSAMVCSFLQIWIRVSPKQIINLRMI